MVPKNRLGREIMGKLFVYAGPSTRTPHKHLRSTTPRRFAAVKENDVSSPLTQTTGRRKEAVARVRLRPGTGTITINSRAFDNYFTSATHRQMVMEPLRLIDAQQTYDIDATIEGGGMAGQAGALRLGISRSLLVIDEAVRPALKKAGLLTRDSRKKETKKYGLKKARKAPQYSKR